MESVHHRELPLVEGSMDNLREWAFEGEPKAVGETERTLRYQIKHMVVCDERMHNASSRVAPQEFGSCPSSKWLGEGFFCALNLVRKVRMGFPELS